MKQWTDLPREDLNMYPEMLAAGFQPKFDHRDKMHGRTTPDNVPHWPIEYYSDTEFIRFATYGGPHWYRCPKNGNGQCLDYPTLRNALYKTQPLNGTGFQRGTPNDESAKLAAHG
jgi:hypothetical protein